MARVELFDETVYAKKIELTSYGIRIELDQEVSGFFWHRHKLTHLEMPLTRVNKQLIKKLEDANGIIKFEGKPFRINLVAFSTDDFDRPVSLP
ncbi:MAG: hypothetical protein KKC75_08705 [Nanoarchaeota archaeon]|nr:hypothetical protein [Nanoarchaeota archaeon]MBU1005154.1 hypothetical protein [Nanoarchaeota archaeon]MBU1946582.1 hypothetical protein [Nanoarchaeota archaeon]